MGSGQIGRSPEAAPDRAGPVESYDIRIARDGTWFYRGSAIQRPALVRLFASVLRRDETGDFWLVTPVERGRITVEDAPFTAVFLTAEGEGPAQVLSFRTNLDETVAAGPDHPIRVDVRAASGEPSPYVEVRPGLDALITRAVFYELAERAVEHEGRLGVWSRGRFFPLVP